jgi:hypothetical protein
VDRRFEFGWDTEWIFLRVELDNGQKLGNNFGLSIGVVDPKYKDGFEVAELAPGITATGYALFIEDTDHEVIDDYPVSSVYCGTRNYAAFQKLYSVLPDDFDIAMIQPGMVIFRPQDLAENVPYNVLVSNQAQHIGMRVFDNTAKFGSAGRLKSVIYMSFGAVAVFDHEIAHTWGAAIGQSLGLLGDQYTSTTDQGHWNKLADMEGQLGLFFFNESGQVGHFSYTGDETWTLIPNYVAEPYSPLELYVMGLIPPEEVPPIHILVEPDLTNTEVITADRYRTVTIEDIIASEGGERVPASADAQKDFNMAFIVTQDLPYNDAAYAFFSLMSYQLTSQDPPSTFNPSLAPFHWASGGRATLETRLPLDLSVPVMPGQPEEEPTPTVEIVEEPTLEPTEVLSEEPEQEEIESEPTTEEVTSEQEQEEVVEKPESDDGLPPWSWLLGGIIVIVPAWLLLRKRRKAPPAISE